MAEPLVLHDRHERRGARFLESDGVLLPRDYGSPAREHAAVRARAGVIDRSERGKIEVTGRDRAQFLHAILAGDVKALGEGAGARMALLDVHGKVTALLVVHAFGDRLLLETDRHLTAILLAGIDRYLFSERVELEDVTAAWGLLTVAGPASRAAVERALGEPLPDLALWHHALTAAAGPGAWIVRTEETGEEGYDLWAPPAALGALWDRLADGGVEPVGREAWDVLRVEAGVVRHGIDVDHGTLLLEAPLPDAYSLSKGCYLGQEVVARITYRGHVNRKVVGFRFDDARVPPPGAPVLVAGQEAGRITSAVVSPSSGHGLALGLLRREHWEPGTRVEVRAGGELLPAQVVALPFYRRAEAA